MQVEGQRGEPSFLAATGARVSNAYTICLQLEDSPWKRGVILHGTVLSHGRIVKVPAVEDECASD